MRIAYLSASKIPSSSANSIHVMKMSSAFSKCGADVHLYARDEGSLVGAFEDYGVDSDFECKRFSWSQIRYIGGLVYGWRVFRSLSKQQGPWWLYGRDLYSLLFMSFGKHPFMYEAHVFPENAIRQKLEKYLFGRPTFRGLTVISDALASEYSLRFKTLPREMITVCRDGASKPVCDSALVKSLRDEFGQRVMVGYVGQLYPGKGMEIISKLSQLLPELGFHVVGGSESDIKYWKDQSIGENVVFHGQVKHSSVPSYLKSMDILLAPYQEKVEAHGGGGDIGKWMSPLKLFEYMSVGRPILCSDLPVLREILNDRFTGVFCSAQNIEQWAKSIREILEKPDFGHEIGAQAEKEFAESYTWEARAEKIVHLMKKER